MKAIFDAARASARTIDANGFMHVKGCPITSAGVFDYARSEVGLQGDPNELVKVDRPLSVITDPEFLASCQNMPIVYLHTFVEGVIQDSTDQDDAQGMDPDKKGVVGVMTNVTFDEASGWVIADLTFYSRALIRQLVAGVATELSLGYTSKLVELLDGEIAARIASMCCNHLAVVDKARVHGARVLDSAAPSSLSEDFAMKKKMLDGAAVDKLRELLLPALQQFLSESAGAEVAEAATDPAADPAAAEVAAEPGAATEAAAAEDVQAVEQAGEPEIVAEDGDDADVSALIKQLIAALAPAAEVGDEEQRCGDEEEQRCGDDAIEPSVEGLADEEAGKEVLTMDSMFVAIAERDKLANRLSRVVGVFDHSTMSLDKVTAYGVKKLGLTHKMGDALPVLSAYLSGVEAANAKTITVKAADSAVETEIDAYLAGKK
jgi:hypothetical protein